MTTTTLTDPGPRAEHDVRSPLLLTVILGALFMNLLDVSIVNVAMGTLRRELGASGAQLQLIVSGYVMAYAVLLVTCARLGDRLGHRRMFRAGMAAFVVTSLACGLAPGAGSLVLFRFLQGAGAAMMLPQVMSLIQRSYPAGPPRSRALGWYGLVLSLGSVAGQVLGGVLLQLDVAGLGWRVVFLVNVPVGLLLWVLAGRHLPRNTTSPGGGLDLPGVALFGLTMGLLVVPLVLGREQGWPLWAWGSLGGAVLSAGVLVMVERRAEARGRGPVVPPRVLRAPGMLAGLLVLLTLVGGYAGYLFTLSLHLQQRLGLDALHTGLAFLPLAIGFAVGGLTSPRLPRPAAHRLILFGVVAVAASYPALAQVLADGRRPGIAFGLVLLLLGLGQGYAVTPVMGLALARVPLTHAGEASGLMSSTFQVAQVLGVTLIGSLFLSTAARHPSGAVPVVCAVLTAVALVALGSAWRLLRAAAVGGP